MKEDKKNQRKNKLDFFLQALWAVLRHARLVFIAFNSWAVLRRATEVDNGTSVRSAWCEIRFTMTSLVLTSEHLPYFHTKLPPMHLVVWSSFDFTLL